MYILYFCHVEFVYISMLKNMQLVHLLIHPFLTYEPFEALVDFVDIQIEANHWFIGSSPSNSGK